MMPNITIKFVTMFHSYDYISLFMLCVDIPVGLDHLFQRIASIYDRFDCSRLNKLFEVFEEEDYIFSLYVV